MLPYLAPIGYRHHYSVPVLVGNGTSTSYTTLPHSCLLFKLERSKSQFKVSNQTRSPQLPELNTSILDLVFLGESLWKTLRIGSVVNLLTCSSFRQTNLYSIFIIPNLQRISQHLNFHLPTLFILQKLHLYIIQLQTTNPPYISPLNSDLTCIIHSPYLLYRL